MTGYRALRLRPQAARGHPGGEERLAETVVSIDIGAGTGAKMALYDGSGREMAGSLLPAERYESTPDGFADALAARVPELTTRVTGDRPAVDGVGIACPGCTRSDGSLLCVNNLSFLEGANLGRLLAERLGVPVISGNDADAGAYAVWSREQTELLYWVFGGGWGGAWIASDGEVRFPSTDWDGRDGSLHFSNEPGYAIPLDKSLLKRRFEEHGISYARFETLCAAGLPGGRGPLAGPEGRTDCLRAETALSGPGRYRIFRAAAEGAGDHERHLTPDERLELRAPASSGKIIDKLGEQGEDTAVRTDALFGALLGEAARILIAQAEKDGCPAGVPIFLAGKPSRAFPFFASSLRRVMKNGGLTNELRVSSLEQEGVNANLLGAALLVLRYLRMSGPGAEAGE